MIISTEAISQILTLIAIMVVVVNIITEVVKEASKLKDAQAINIFVTCLSVALSVGTFVTYFQLSGMHITWFNIVGFIVVGFMVAYAAMFGYDKLLSYFKGIKGE